jgi:hypothetical protein
MEVPRTINCTSFWNALLLKSILEEHGVLVHPPQEQVFLTLTVSGPPDVIKTVVCALQGKYPRSSPIHIEGMEPASSTLPSTNGAHAPAADPSPSPAPSAAPQRRPRAVSASCPPSLTAPNAPSTPAHER